MDSLVISIIAFFILLAVLVALRIKTGGQVEIKNSDIMVPLILVGLILFMTGKIQEFGFGDFKIVAAIEAASNSPVANQVTQVTELPVESVQVDSKMGTDYIPQLIEKKSEALRFRLGHGGYWGPAIEEYFRQLTRYPFLKYIVVNDENGNFWCLADARKLAALLEGRDHPFDYQMLANWLNKSNKEALQENLPGFIPAVDAVRNKSDKRRALTIMDSLDVEILPVTDPGDKFQGIVERSKLTASMLIDIADRLNIEK